MSNYVALKPLLPELTRIHLACTLEAPYISLCGISTAWEVQSTINARNVCQTCLRAYKARLEAFQATVKGREEA